MNRYLMVIVVVLLCLIIFLATLFYITAIKEDEIQNLTTQLSKYLGDEDKFVGSWERYLGNDTHFFVDMIIKSDKTSRLEYATIGTTLGTYSINEGVIRFTSGTSYIEFDYCFLDDNTLILSLTEPYPDGIPPKAIFIRQW